MADSAFAYPQLRWVNESEDPSLTIETESLVAKIIDNTGLTREPESAAEPGCTHHLGYHGIRSLYARNERRNIVSPFFSMLNLQGIRVDGLEPDPADHRARFGLPRGWPMTLRQVGSAVVLEIPEMPVSGIACRMSLRPAGEDAIEFEAVFRLARKTARVAAFHAQWACYMSTFDEVALHSPVRPAGGPGHDLQWTPFGEPEAFVLGDWTGYQASQKRFDPPEPAARPAAFGRIGSRYLLLQADRPEVRFFVINGGGHLGFLPVQNPAWDFEFRLPDYEPGEAFGFRGRLVYAPWQGFAEVNRRVAEWSGIAGSSG